MHTLTLLEAGEPAAISLVGPALVTIVLAGSES